jgi:ribosomal protein L37AE/L43A
MAYSYPSGQGSHPATKEGDEEVRRAKILSHATISKPGYFVCPACGSGEVLARGSNLARCNSCGCAFDGTIVEILKQIVALPDALGEHACEECDHPELRHLPDGVFHCPACSSEVLPILLAPSFKSSS